MDSPQANPREISSRSASDNRNRQRTGSRLGSFITALIARATALPRPRNLLADAAQRRSLSHQLSDPLLLLMRQSIDHHTTSRPDCRSPA
jgi:hypothetical protein